MKDKDMDEAVPASSTFKRGRGGHKKPKTTAERLRMEHRVAETKLATAIKNKKLAFKAYTNAKTVFDSNHGTDISQLLKNTIFPHGTSINKAISNLGELAVVCHAIETRLKTQKTVIEATDTLEAAKAALAAVEEEHMSEIEDEFSLREK
jgi:hypothetical protein